MTTGLLNRNSFNRFCTESEKNGGCGGFCAVFMDINGLHQVNNEYGHEAGDRLLKTTADMAMLLNKDRYYKGKNIEHR